MKTNINFNPDICDVLDGSLMKMIDKCLILNDWFADLIERTKKF